MTNPLSRLSGLVGRLPALIGARWKNTFYVHLAVVFSLFIVVDALVLHLTGNMRQAAFDVMVRYRLAVSRPDDRIVIVDINEASLAAMAKEYGRWPWPRQVLGEFLEHLEAQRPRAVIFDILFGDPDVYNPDSDAYFDAAVAPTTNTFFPFLRLDEANDALSQVTAEMIPGVTPIPGAAQAGARLAVVLPHFTSVLQGGRLGFQNSYPDRDGIVREYVVYRDDHGWKVPSLPARVVRELRGHDPIPARVLLNWRGKPFSYRTVTFSDVYNDMLSRQKTRPQDEFTDRIVLIGSTAAGLFDIKPTPMSQLHPGVEILATAIDNLNRGDYLRYPKGHALYGLVTLAIVWVTAQGFYRNAGRDKIDRLFGASQVILIGVSYASLNLSNTYIDLTGPVTVGLGYFTLARVYAVATRRVLETSVLRASVAQPGEFQGVLLLVQVDGRLDDGADRTLGQIRRRLEKVGTEPRSVDVLNGQQEGIWTLFEHVLAVSWAVPAGDRAARERVSRDIEHITSVLGSGLREPGTDQAVTWVVHERPISGGERARAGWRALLAEAQLRGASSSDQNTGATA